MVERLGSRRVLILAALGAAVLVGVFSATNLASSTVYYLTPSEAFARTVATGTGILMLIPATILAWALRQGRVRTAS